MRAFTAFAILALIGFAAAASVADQFAEFKATYNKKYASPAEEATRFAVFEQNMAIAAKHQAVNPHATFGMNEYSDVSAVEFKVRHNMEKQYEQMVAQRRGEVPTDLYTAEEIRARTVEKIDWRTKGAVTYIRNQGQCGSCWSFGTVVGIEGQWFLAGHKLVALSEQEFVSCDTTNDGCNGGYPSKAMAWDIQERGGKLVTAQSYPYVSGNGQVPACSWKGTVVAAEIDGYKYLPKNEKQMAAWCAANGPMTIVVDASSFQTYTSGILTNCVSQQVDHCVAVVGFDLTNSPPYWIVKNSWGTSWGEKGYIRVEYGTDQCLITSGPIIAEVKKGGTPLPPSPPSPPTPTYTPTPAPSKTFSQKVCQNSACTDGCQTHTFPQDQCLKLQGGGSAMAKCVPGGLMMTSYIFSNDCKGLGIPQVNPVNQCFPTQSGDYAEDICPSGFRASAVSAPVETAGFRLNKLIADEANASAGKN